jgi:Zn-dependent peptidase ImmA (M78 family)/transcriptional regulator with XRE-family HTH domain
MPAINYELIILARESMGVTQAELAEKLFVEQSTISKIEHGLIPPTNDLIDKISIFLEYPSEFFYQEWKPIRVEGHYRRKLTLPAKMIKECKAKMTIVERHLSTLADSLELPKSNYPKWDVDVDGSPAMCAKYLREFWKLPKGRIENLTRTLEDNGIIVVELDLDEMEGFSTFSKDGYALMFINKDRPGDRDLFTKAHELFHIIAHFGLKVGDDRDIEKEAHEFASEFLLPTNDIQHDLVRLNLSKLADLKRYWRVSMASMIMKAKNCGLLTQNQSEYLWKQMSASGYKKKEPIQTVREKATLFQEILSTYLEEFAYTKQELEAVLHFPTVKIDEWYFDKRPNRLKAIRRIA